MEWFLFFGKSVLESLYMTVISTVSAFAAGMLLGIVLVLTDEKGLTPMPRLNQVLGLIVNVLRSLPFLILMVAILPLTKILAGSYIGLNATIVPLIVAATPFVARLVETSLKEVDHGIIEAAVSMGASTWDIVWRVMLSEARPALVRGFTVTSITILGYSAMAGTYGGGGLGSIAINYGMYKFNPQIMWTSIILLLLLVEGMQRLGMRIAAKIEHRKN